VIRYAKYLVVIRYAKNLVMSTNERYITVLTVISRNPHILPHTVSVNLSSLFVLFLLYFFPNPISPPPPPPPSSHHSQRLSTLKPS